MQTRRDQLHAYRFQNRRALAALVTGEPNVLEPPMRRLTVITVSGIMIAILVACGFGLVGVFKPATGDKWRAAGAIIVERETGARYVLLDGTLHPVLNYASAVLAVGPNQHPHVVLVDRGDLKGTRRGATIGIGGLPDSLPSAGNLIATPWTVCSRQQAGANQQLTAQVSVLVGSNAGARPVPSGSGVLVHAVDDDQVYLLLNGRRLAVASAAVATSLSLPMSTTLPVGTAFLNGVPAGPTLRAPDVPGAGAPSGVTVDGQRVTIGRLLFTRDNQRYFLTLADGVAPLDDVQAQLLLTLPIGPGGQLLPRIETTESAVLNQPASREWSKVADELRGLPSRIPQIAPGGAQNGGVCVVYRQGSAAPVVAIPPSRLPAFPADQVTQSARSRAGQADQVLLQPGRAAVARSTGGAATVFVVADPGRKYAAVSRDVLGGFGYGNVKPAVVPGEVLLLVPTGPALDPTAARRPAGG